MIATGIDRIELRGHPDRKQLREAEIHLIPDNSGR